MKSNYYKGNPINNKSIAKDCEQYFARRTWISCDLRVQSIQTAIKYTTSSESETNNR